MLRKKHLFFLVLFLIVFPRLSYCQNFVVVTPEKTGTHLLIKALSRLTGLSTIHCWAHWLPTEEIPNYLKSAKEQNAFFHMHAQPFQNFIDTMRQSGYRIIFLIRDPRDQAVSLL